MADYAHFDLSHLLDENDRKDLVFKLNGFLPGDIAIYDILPVRTGVNARFSAVSRTYKYVISTGKNPFLTGYSYSSVPAIKCVEQMNEGAAILLETKDFTSFSKVDTDAKTNICSVYSACWEREGV